MAECPCCIRHTFHFIPLDLIVHASITEIFIRSCELCSPNWRWRCPAGACGRRARAARTWWWWRRARSCARRAARLCRPPSRRPASSCPTAPSTGAAPAWAAWPPGPAARSSAKPSPASTTGRSLTALHSLSATLL